MNSDLTEVESPGVVPESAFLDDCVRVKIANLLPLKAIRPEIKISMKYQQILASVRAVGLVEPPVVTPVPKQKGSYFLLDGHLRVEALKDLSVDAVDCLVAKDDDTYSYNKRVNRLSAVQDHKMIVRAMQRGASAERLGGALGLSPQTIRAHFRLLKGICDEAAELLSDAPCAAKIFDILRMMKPLRQIEVAELMQIEQYQVWPWRVHIWRLASQECERLVAALHVVQINQHMSVKKRLFGQEGMVRVVFH